MKIDIYYNEKYLITFHKIINEFDKEMQINRIDENKYV